MAALPQDVLLCVFSHLSCVDTIRAGAVCTQWRQVSQCAALHQAQLLQEFNLTGDASACDKFKFFVRSPLTPVLSDISRFDELISIIGNSWQLRLTSPCNCADQKPTSSLPSSSVENQRPPHQISRIFDPDRVTINPQSVWIEYTCDLDWLTHHIHLELVATIRQHDLVVIDVPRWKTPVDDTAMLLQSHTDGIYAWFTNDETVRLVAYVHMEHLLPLAHGTARSNKALRGQWGQLTPAGLHTTISTTASKPSTINSSGALPGPALPSSVPIPVTCTQHQTPHLSLSALRVDEHSSRASAEEGSSSQPVQPQVQQQQQCKAEGTSAATTSPALVIQDQARIGLFLHIDSAQLSSEDTRCSWVLLLICRQQGDQLQLGQQEQMVFTASSGEGLWAKLPPDAELSPNTTCADARLGACLQLATRAGFPVTTCPCQRLPTPDPCLASTSSEGSVGPDLSPYGPAVPELIAALDREGMIDFSLYPLGWTYQQTYGGSVGAAAHIPDQVPGSHIGAANSTQGGKDVGAGRLLLGRCGVEVWQQQDLDLPEEGHQPWTAFIHPGQGAAQPPPASSFVRHVAHFLVDGVQQQMLWENSLEFWFHMDAFQGAEEEGGNRDSIRLSTNPMAGWGLAKLVLTAASVRQLWGLAP